MNEHAGLSILAEDGTLHTRQLPPWAWDGIFGKVIRLTQTYIIACKGCVRTIHVRNKQDSVTESVCSSIRWLVGAAIDMRPLSIGRRTDVLVADGHVEEWHVAHKRPHTTAKILKVISFVF